MTHKLTTLNKLKNHIIRKCQISNTNHRLKKGLPRGDYNVIKSVLTYESAVSVIGRLDVWHIDNTQTIMIDGKQADFIVDWINGIVSSVEIPTLPKSAYQFPPEHKTYHVLINREDVVKLFTYADQFERKHHIKKVATNKVDVKIAQYNGAVRSLNLIKESFNANKRLLCIDVEAFEFKQEKIIEVGFCVWHNGNTKHYHYIVKENARYRNKRYVPDNRDHFLFGTTVYLSLEDITKIVINEAKLCDYLVGHSIAGDIEWLSNHGFNYDSRYFDTAMVGRCVKDFDKRTPGLKELYEHFGGHAEYMHNGGNDAAYTMSVLESMAKETTPYRKIGAMK